MELLKSKDGQLYRLVRSWGKAKALRVGDDYIHPNPRELIPATASDLKQTEQAQSEQEKEAEPTVGTLEMPSEHFDWKNLVLYPNTVQSIRMAVNSILNRAQLESVFHISAIDPSSKCLLNFWGAPGTGKTAAAKALSREIGMPMLQADYSQITSKWVGDTSKGIKLLFEEAKDRKAVLFLDEADALAARRIDNPSDSAGVHGNQEKNVFMQELDKFSGIVVMTTNLFENYDQALLRRIAKHVKFDLPNKDMRDKIVRQLFGKTVNVRVNFDNLATVTEGFSGGDLLNVVKNSIEMAALEGSDPSKWLISDIIVNTVVKSIIESKQVTGNLTSKKPMGLHAA